MIRRYYALPQEEYGCNAILLEHYHVYPNGLQIEARPGTAELAGGQVVTLAPGVDALIGASVEDGTFAPDPVVGSRPESVLDVEDYLAWRAEQTPNADDHPMQQEVSMGLFYLWLQRKGLRPLPES